MLISFGDLWLILRKELTNCWRDPDVLIYGFLLPVVLYPLVGVILNEAAIWYMGAQEKNKQLVCVEPGGELASEIAADLKGRKHLNVVSAKGVDEDLIAGRAGAIVKVDGTHVTIRTHETPNVFMGSKSLAEEIELDIREARYLELKKVLATKHVPEGFLTVFVTERQSLKASEKGLVKANEAKSYWDQLMALTVFLAIAMMTITAGAASVGMVTEEREKKTLHTTLLLPVARANIVAAKFLAVTTISVTCAIFNFLCVGVFCVFMGLEMWFQTLNIGQLIYRLQHITVQDVIYVSGCGVIVGHRIMTLVEFPSLGDWLWCGLIVVSAALVLSAACLSVSSFGRSVKEAQVLVTMPMLVLMSLPGVFFIPGIQFSLKTAFIPIVNLMLLHKAVHPPPLLALLAVLEPAILCLLLLWVVQTLFFKEFESTRKPNAKGSQV